jgi:fermentation-respiration switch protein FrsA (DUF1100 family)
LKRLGSRLAAALAILAALAYVGAGTAFTLKQAEWIHASPRERAPGPVAGLRGEEVRISTGTRGETLAAWWLPTNERAPAVLYLMGMGHTLRDEAASVAILSGAGLSVLAIEYRGFGLSDGAASEASLYEDGLAAWDELRRLAPSAARRSVYGHSLGGAVAIEVASRRADVDALVLESTFTTMAEVVRQSRIVRLFPVRLLLTQRYDSLAKLPGVAAPVLFIHGGADDFVPPRMSEALFAAAREPRWLVRVPGAGHTGAMAGSAEARRAATGLLGGWDQQRVP